MKFSLQKLMPVLLLVCSGLVLCTIFLIPLNSDGDLYQAMAIDLVRYDKLPYMGSWDQNFPGIVYLHAFAITLFGNSDTGFRIIDLLANITICICIYRILRTYVSSVTASLTCLLYGLYYVSGGWWAIGQRDMFASCLLIIAIMLMLERWSSSAWARILAGLMIGSASMIRPTYALFLPAIMVALTNRRGIWLLAASSLAPLLLFAGLFKLTGGDLGEVLLAVITYNTQAYGGIAEPWSRLLDRSQIQWLLIALATVGSVWGRRQLTTNLSLRLAMAGVLTGLVSILVMRKYFIYHFHVFIVFLLPIAALTIEFVVSRARSSALRYALVAAVSILMLWSFYPRHLLGIGARASGSVADRVGVVRSAFSIDSSFGRAVDLRITSYLQGETDVELVSVTPAVHWMNELDRPSRFTMIHPLTITGPDGRLSSFQEAWRHEYLTALQKRRPRIIALADGPAFLMKYIRRSPKDLALEITGQNGYINGGQLSFARLLEEQYVLDTTIGGYYIYTRNVP